MKSNTLFLMALVVFSAKLDAADVERLNKSTPPGKGRGRIESCASTLEHVGNKHKSAPGRLSAEECREDDTVEQIPLEEKKLKRKNLSDSPLQCSRVSSKSPSKKFFFISSEMLDDVSNMGMSQLRDEIKKVAYDNNLKKSNFYAIVKNMRPEIVRASAQIMMLSNYFIFKIATTEAFKSYLNTAPSLIPVPNQDFRVCVETIRTCLDQVTHNAITWPTVRREENSQRYYQELLEENRAINVSDVAFAYYGATVAIMLLSQVKDRSLNMRDKIKPIAGSAKLAKKHCKAIVKSFQAMACFVPNLNIAFDPAPLKDECSSDDEE